MKALLPNVFHTLIQRTVRTAVLTALVGVALPAWSTLSVNAGTGTVSDSATNLMWDQCPYGLSGSSCASGTIFLDSWQNALAAAAHANAINYKGFSNWRVPNKNELESIAKTDVYTAGQPAIDTTAFPATPISGDHWGLGATWSSTTYAPDAASAWYIAFNYGKTLANAKALSSYLRLVRNGQSLASYDALAMDLAVTNAGSVTPVVAGGNLSYTITVTNNGPAAAETAAWNETLPTGTTFVSLPAVAGWTCTTPAVASAGSVSCSNPSVASGASAVFILTVAVDAATAGGTVLSNTVTVSSTTTDTVSTNNSATVSTGVTAQSPSATTLAASGVSTIGATLNGTVSANGTSTTVSFEYGATAAYGSVVTAAQSPVSTSGASVSAAVTGLACATTYHFRVDAVNGGGSINGSDMTFSTSACAVVVTPPTTTTPTIPLLPFTVTIPGISVVPAYVNMAAGDGPSFMADLIAMLSKAVGQPLHFVEQNALGAVVLGGYSGGNLAYVPSNFQGGGDNRSNGIYAMGDGRYQGVRGGQSLTIAPTLVLLNQLTALFPGLSANLGDNGVITATINGVTYVVQPGVAVQLNAATGRAQLVMGSDGYWRFIDALGNNQILYPAFADPIGLRNALQALDPAATVAIQLDGTASIVFNGQPNTLVPDLTLGQVPADRVGQAVWQESVVRYRVTNLQPLGTTQGFTVKP